MPASMYNKDEKVLCFHHEILYDAKILDIRQKDSTDKKSPLEYRVHYKGWKNTWDDWVLEDRLRKATEENRELATNIRREAEESARAKSSKSAPKKRGTSERDSVRDSEERGNSVSARGNKRGRGDNDIETEEQFQARPAIRIVIPDNLKSLIVDDWERVSKNGTVVDLPAPRPIRQIFNEYRDEEAPKRGSRIDRDVLDEIIVGLSEYFEVMLDKVLLYRYERAQYRQLCERHSNQEDHGPVAVYGAEHLLRLFSLLPELLAQTNMTQTGTNRMREEVSKLSIWLSRNCERYFRTEYVPAENYY